MKDSASGRMNMITAFLARERPASGHQVMLRDLATFLTVDAIGPAIVFQPFKASRIIGKLLSEVENRVLLHCRCLSLPNLILSILAVKG